MKIRKYFVKHDPLCVLTSVGCNDMCLDLARMGMNCKATFPDFQISFGFGTSPIRRESRRTFTWFLDTDGKPRVSINSRESDSAHYYVGLWFSKGTPRHGIVAPPGALSEIEWIWATDSREKLNKGALNAFFGNG